MSQPEKMLWNCRSRRHRLLSESAQHLDQGMTGLLNDFFDTEFKNYIAKRGLVVFEGHVTFKP